MARKNIRVRGKVTNVERVDASLRRTSSALDDIADQSIGDLAHRSVEILQGVAPKGRSGQLGRGIKARRRGAHSLDITVHAVSKLTGFDYAGVTRFGHQVEEITPTEGRKALRVSFQHGDVGFFDRVRGFQPTGDWVDLGLPAIRSEAERVAKQAGRAIELRLFS